MGYGPDTLPTVIAWLQKTAGACMSAYTLQKMIRDVNRRPDRRDAYFASRERRSPQATT